MAVVQPSQVAQCLKEFAVRCSEPRNMRMNMYLLENCNWSKKEVKISHSYHSHEERRPY